MLFDKFLQQLEGFDKVLLFDPADYDDGEIIYKGVKQIILKDFELYFDFHIVEYGNETRATYLQPSEWIRENVTAQTSNIEVFENSEGHRLELNGRQEEQLRTMLEQKIERQLR